MARGRGSAYKSQLGQRGSGKLAGGMNSVFQSNLARQNSNKSNFNLKDLAGVGAGFLTGGNPGEFGQQNVDYQKAISEDVLDKTSVDINGVGYNNIWKDGNLISNLTGVNKDIYDQSGDLTTMFGNQMKDYNSGGFEAMEQRRLERMRALTSEDNERRAQQIRERDQNTGASLYQQYYNSRAEGDRLNREDLGFQEAAFGQAIQGGNYLSGQRTGAQDSMTASASPANTMLTSQLTKMNATGNIAAEAKAGTMLADQLAYAAEKKDKQKSKFWGSLIEFGGNALMPGAGTVAKGLFT